MEARCSMAEQWSHSKSGSPWELGLGSSIFFPLFLIFFGAAVYFIQASPAIEGTFFFNDVGE
jgi:hypothetical protein